VNTAAPGGSALLTRWLPLALLALVVGHYFFFIERHAPNIPYQDDVLDFLQVMAFTETSPGPADTAAILATQHNDHRTMASRLVVYTLFKLQGEVNFRTLVLVANLALPLMLFLFYLRVRTAAYRWVWLLPAALVLLHFRAFTLMLWSQAAFGNYWVFLYAFACLFAVHRVTWPRLALAALFCTLASFTLASGLVVWVLGLASLVLQSLFGERRPWIFAAVWLLAGASALLLWTTGFASVPDEDVIALFPDNAMNAPLAEQLYRYAAFFLAIVGSAVSTESVVAAQAAGMLMLLALAVCSLLALRDGDLRLELCCWFAVASAAAMSAGRALWLEPSYVMDARYTFVSVVLLAGLLVLVQARLKLRGVAAGLCVCACAVYATWIYRHFTPQLEATLQARIETFNRGHYPVFGQRTGVSTRIVADAIEQGVYLPPCRPYPDCRRDD